MMSGPMLKRCVGGFLRAFPNDSSVAARGPCRSRPLVAAALIAALAGCGQLALQRISPGESAAEVKRSAGAPSEERTLADGTKAWYYVYGPSGWTTYRVRFGANGGVVDAKQVLTEKNFREELIVNKTTRDQTAQALGKPGLVMQFPNLQEEVWTYRWLDTTIPMKADAHFDLKTGQLKSYNLYWDPCPRASLECMGT
jgi:outer membrane protein assembly factor BamE (lipoprotein component of BamABCDE complex)